MKEAKELLPGGVNSPGALISRAGGSEVSGSFRPKVYATRTCWEHTAEGN